MTVRKRKAPDRRKPVKEPGLLSHLAVTAGRAVARRPRTMAGISSFVVVFSFVAANALWYQPSNHPSPFLATRDADDPNAIAGYRPMRPTDPENVTTFRIERADPDAPETTGTATPAASRAEPSYEPVPAVAPEPAAPVRPVPDKGLVAEIQRELLRRGLYQGTDDGVVGPLTESAILFFQETVGLSQTGEPTPALLAALKAGPRAAETVPKAAQPAISRPAISQPVIAQPAPAQRPAQAEPQKAVASREQSSPVPAMRPRENVKSGEDPVAAAIRAADKTPSLRPPADIPGSARAIPASQRTVTLPASDLVLQIQRGLSNIAYADVAVDGVAGEQTKAAIRRFERHYRLPETGEPNEQVLKKLKSIGAL